MTFKNVTRGLALGAAVAGLSLSADAQNGTNYHALNNGLDVVFGGVGAGGGQTAGDGVGFWIPGEDLRGATRDNIEGDFAYKQYGWRESACILSSAPGGINTLHYPTIVWLEYLGTGNGNTGHRPVVFTNPIDASCIGFPLGGTGGFIGFGAPAGSSANFIAFGLPSALGTGAFLGPNENIIPSASFTASVFLLAGANVAPTPINSTGFCWGSQFQWTPSALPTIKDATNGWWHWVSNNPLGNQYWGFSGDEQNVYASRTVASDAGVTGILAFPVDSEYAATSISIQPNTNLATSPAGFFAGGAYYTNTANVVDGITGTPTLNINSGYDMGGHGTLSLTGESGVPSPNTGLAAQDPAGVGGVNPSGGPLLPSIGFHTYDTTSGSGTSGSKRITWLTVDTDHITGLFAPEDEVPLTVLGGAVRVPSVNALATPGGVPGITIQLLSLFSHETAPCATCTAGAPGGFPPGTFGVPDTQGASIQLPIPPLGSVCTPGVPLAVTYGSSGLKGPAGVGAPGGGLTWIQSEAATSGHKTFFLFD